MKKYFVILFLVAAVFFGSCYYDVEEDLIIGGGSCDTTNVTFSGTVFPLLQSNGCTSCHSGGAPSGNISLDGYNNVRTVALNGRLYGSISHSPGFSPMPQGGNKMSTCNINRIKAWIDSGSPNN